MLSKYSAQSFVPKYSLRQTDSGRLGPYPLTQEKKEARKHIGSLVSIGGLHLAVQSLRLAGPHLVLDVARISNHSCHGDTLDVVDDKALRADAELAVARAITRTFDVCAPRQSPYASCCGR